MAPTDWPWRNLKLAMDLRARVTTGLWPVMAESCSTEASRIFPLEMASPSPMFTTTLSRRGACSRFRYPNSCTRAGRISFRYRCFSRAGMSPSPRSSLPRLVALPARSHPPAVPLAHHVPHAGGLVALGTHHHHVGEVQGALLLDDAPLALALAASLLEMALHGHELLDPHPAARVPPGRRCASPPSPGPC